MVRIIIIIIIIFTYNSVIKWHNKNVCSWRIKISECKKVFIDFYRTRVKTEARVQEHNSRVVRIYITKAKRKNNNAEKVYSNVYECDELNWNATTKKKMYLLNCFYYSPLSLRRCKVYENYFKMNNEFIECKWRLRRHV